MRWMAVVGSSLIVACSAGAPSGSSRPAPGDHLACQPGEAGAADIPLATEGETARAGQMTEKAAQAKRLYDQERWQEARAALLAIVRGETQDDEGNRQVAQYYAAVCAYRMHDRVTALDEMAPIAQNPFHLKHVSSLIWIAKLSHVPELTTVAVDLVAGYAPEVIDRFDNPQQREIWEHVAFLHGRALYRRGEPGKARVWLSRVRADSRYHPLAQACLQLAR